ncbi:MAG: PilZ domain-containing protein [Candidatus Omnitrophica bacterium]|nr:PilZ domain-containing protein [Candidatus Omnitrophota bacterium]
MEEKNFVERRRYVRLNVNTKVNFMVKGEKDVSRENLSGLSKNISIEGICFTSKQQLKPGANLQLEIFFPSDPEPLLLRGEVKWCWPIEAPEGKDSVSFGIGVKLYTLKKTDENRYMRYVLDKMMERFSRYLHL